MSTSSYARMAALAGMVGVSLGALASGGVPASAVPGPPGTLAAPAPAGPKAAEAPVAPPRLAPDRERLGRSGALEVLFALPSERVHLPLRWETPVPQGAWARWRPLRGMAADTLPLSGDLALTAPDAPGTYALEVGVGTEASTVEGIHLVVQVPFESKRDGYIGRYFIGSYPTEGRPRGGRYALPAGFIRVDRETADLRLSEHFRVREFLTHDQADVWPKYAVVSPLLLDKLELVLDELERSSVPAKRMVVMSGFRTPQYNRNGLDAGRGVLSRHQWGDAADVWVDNDGDWYMDDLNGDGRRDTRDARVMLRAVERVEAAHPELVGGAGLYPDNGAHGPFIHVDTRGQAARW